MRTVCGRATKGCSAGQSVNSLGRAALALPTPGVKSWPATLFRNLTQAATRRRRFLRRVAAVIKSRDPHLAGGEKWLLCCLCWKSYLPRSLFKMHRSRSTPCCNATPKAHHQSTKPHELTMPISIIQAQWPLPSRHHESRAQLYGTVAVA